MVLVYMADGECVEVEDAVRAETTDAELLCLDWAGRVVRSFNAKDVTMFTNDPALAEIISDEVCDEEISDDETAGATI